MRLANCEPGPTLAAKTQSRSAPIEIRFARLAAAAQSRWRHQRDRTARLRVFGSIKFEGRHVFPEAVGAVGGTSET